MRIAVGSLQQETNTFSPLMSYYGDFDIARGEEVFRNIFSGQILEKYCCKAIPVLYANAIPGGILEYQSYKRFKDEIVDNIPYDIDGVLLHMHGALEVEKVGSGEADLVSAIRKKVGKDVLISLSLDLHANMDKKLIEASDIICGYRTAPHIDVAETQIKAAKLLIQCLEKGIKPRPVMIRVPVILTGDMPNTFIEPLKSMMAELDNIEANYDDVVSISLFNGQVWVDSPNTSASIVAIGKSDCKVAYEKAKEIAIKFWNIKHQISFNEEALAPQDAIDAAIASKGKRVFITDSGDNPGAGAAGESTYLLEILISKRISNTLVASIMDSDIIKLCDKYEVGESLEAYLGNKTGIKSSYPFKRRFLLKGKGQVPDWCSGDATTTGNKLISAVLLGIEGIDIIVTEKKCSFQSVGYFQSIENLNVKDYSTIVIKCGYLSPLLEHLSDRTILALTPGSSCEDILALKYNQIRRPIYPIDKDIEFIC